MMFGDILSNTFKQYEKNFKYYILLTLILFTIPVFLMNILQSAIVSSSSNKLLLLIVNFVVIILTLLFSLLSVVVLISSFIKKKSLTKSIKIGTSHFWRALGLSIIMSILLFFLFLLFIIPGLIFVIYWTFAIFVLVDQKKKPGASLKTSMNLVKNNWWRTFGYLLLFNIIISAFYLLITFVLGLLAIPIAHFNLLLGTWYLIFISSLLSLFITPFSLLFLYNFYLKQKSL